jgi:hypothetical protein
MDMSEINTFEDAKRYLEQEFDEDVDIPLELVCQYYFSMGENSGLRQARAVMGKL